MAVGSGRQLSNGLKVIHSNRMEDLRDMVVNLLRIYPLAPLENEHVVVQSNGIGQWLKLAIAADSGVAGSDNDRDDGENSLLPESSLDISSGGCGIAAGMKFLLPSRFVWQVYRSLLGEEAVPKTSPLDKSRLTWRLMKLLPALSTEPRFDPLTRFMAGGQPDRKRFQLAAGVADLFDQYQVYRADWLSGWAKGENLIRDARGVEKALGEHNLWQPELWRRLLSDLRSETGGVTPVAGSSRAAVHQAFMKRVGGAAGQSSLLPPPGLTSHGLPSRVIVFGVSSLPQQAVEVLAAIAGWTQVILCVHNPCEYYWADIVADKDLLKAAFRRGRPKPGMPKSLSGIMDVLQHANPLLAAWGKQGRDYIRLLDEVDNTASYQQEFARIDLFDQRDGGCLLHQVQDDIRQLRPLAESRLHWPSIDPRADRSIVLTCAHSAQREVEILQDQLLAAFSADPALKPRDIFVMVPDINVYAPHIQAVFGRIGMDDDRYIPFTIADQGSRHREPVLIALEKLLSLPDSRLTAGDVLDLLDLPVVRERFGIAEDDLPRLRQWIEGANIRWGLHAAHRAAMDLPATLEKHTWQFGLRRMLLGYSVGNGDAWQDIEPYDEVGGLEAACAGSLYLFLQALEETLALLSESRPPQEWAVQIRLLQERFLAESDGTAAVLLTRLEDAIEDWLDACREAGLTEALPLTIVREVLLEKLEDSSLAQRFLVGKVNFGTLLPMRAIPFKRVCLLGMNDGDYPRSRQGQDFDLMLKDYRPGDRSRREDDRYLFLEALLSAREQLMISWIGRSVRDNSERPPSVLVAQLLDHLDAMHPSTPPLSRRLVTEHPLQPFSQRYFLHDSQQQGLFTYAREWREAHTATTPESSEAGRLCDTPLPLIKPAEAVSLTEVVAFLKSPVTAFFQQRLKVWLDDSEHGLRNDEPFKLDKLQNWTLQDELIRGDVLTTDAEKEMLLATQRRLLRMDRRGDLGMGPLRDCAKLALQEPLPELFAEWTRLKGLYPLKLPGKMLAFTLQHEAGDVQLEDWLENLRSNAQEDIVRVVTLSSALNPRKSGYLRHLLAPWLAHLVACAQGIELTTFVLAKEGKATFHPIASQQAGGHLASILEGWLQGMRSPLPVTADLAFQWLSRKATDSDDSIQAKLCLAYEGDAYTDGAVTWCPYLRRAYPDFASFGDLAEFRQWSQQLYQPLFNQVRGNS
jgi:exodeoxyribonuclease V gamma subunit